MSRDQRIAATRVVYYLIISAIIMALVLPFFAQKTARVDAMATSQIAEVALNVLGIIHLVLHVFLRSNAERTAIQPMESTWAKKQRLRLFGPSDLEMTMHITSPVLLEKEGGKQLDNDNHKLMNDLRRFSRAAKYVPSPTVETDVPYAEVIDEKRAEKSHCLEPYRSPPQALLLACPPRKTSSYSIFPTFRSAMLRNSMSTTFSQDNEETLQPPKPILLSSHKREFSEQSSATVQIGCRLSNLNDMQHHPCPSPATSSFRLPIYGTNQMTAESPPISPLSTRPNVASGASQDIVVLPIQPKKGRHSEYLRDPRQEFFSSNRFGRQQSQPRSQGERYRRMTMKALPPDPPAYNSS
ncbi:MAG: hypothetical protein Q9225_006575 [Loekoesia sp. 1 TL-2023]